MPKPRHWQFANNLRFDTPGNWQARLDSNQGLRESKSRAFDQLGDAPMMMVAERDGFEPTSFRLKGGHPKPLDERSNWRGLVLLSQKAAVSGI